MEEGRNSTSELRAEVARLRARVSELEELLEGRPGAPDGPDRVPALYGEPYARAPVMMHSIDADARLLEVSDEWLHALGYTRDEVIGRKPTEFLTEESRRYAENVTIPAFLRDGVARDISYQFVKKNGEIMDVLLSAVAERHPDGSFRRSLAVLVDVTDRKRAEEALRLARESTEEQVQRRTTTLSETVRMLEEQIVERRKAEEQVERQRAFLRQVIDVDPNFIFAKDRDGRFTLVNQAVADAYGTTVEELTGKTDADFNPNREQVEFFRSMDLKVMETGEEYFIPEEKITDSMGNVRWLQTVKRPIVDPDGNATQILGSATDITARREAESKLRRSEAALLASREELQALTGRLLTAQEEERRRLAREMHDDLTQRMAALSIEAGNLENLLSSDEPVRGKLAEMKRQLVQLSDDVQAISRQLHPSILDDLGLVDALESECTNFARLQGITVAFHAEGVPRDVAPDLALSLYRIAQEALHNIAKHAGPAGADVQLRCSNGAIELSVRDSGCGFETRERRGLGLASMEERARLVGGEFHIESTPGTGTHVRVVIPLDPCHAP